MEKINGLDSIESKNAEIIGSSPIMTLLILKHIKKQNKKQEKK